MFRYLKHLYKIHDLLPQAWHHRFTFVVMNFEIYIVAQLCVTRWWICVLSTLYWVYSCHVCQILLTAVFVVETWIILPTKNLLKLLCLLLTPGKSYQSCRHCQKCWVQTLNAWQVGETFNKNLGFVQWSFKIHLMWYLNIKQIGSFGCHGNLRLLMRSSRGETVNQLGCFSTTIFLFKLNTLKVSSYCFVFLFPSPMTGVLCGELRRRGVGWNIDL